MATRRIIHRQPGVKGGRDALPSCVLHEIERAVQRKADEFSVSRSWVVATILADYFQINEQVSCFTIRRKGEFGTKLTSLFSRAT